MGLAVGIPCCVRHLQRTTGLYSKQIIPSTLLFMLFEKQYPAQKKTPRLMDVLFCAETQNRTADTAIFSRMLYQLSYLGQHPY